MILETKDVQLIITLYHAAFFNKIFKKLNIFNYIPSFIEQHNFQNITMIRYTYSVNGYITWKKVEP